MKYGHHHAEGAVVLGARSGQHGPFGRWSAPGEGADTAGPTRAGWCAARAPERAVTTLWRQILTALTDDTLDAAEREQLLARGAAQLAVRRTPEGHRPPPTT
ncbi:hypothetical protein PS783_37940 (plasmid) [Streptomyces enissocaesilis]|uniref:hypothetical protein n=1 Tax=Streptomyces TaxID=1883 RepID=UPI001CBCD138|nr:hypothetical protein [Streptomyces sp. A144]WDI23404.1 hypothetical protein PS783_37940 [Streptomyces enissocaesilis]